MIIIILYYDNMIINVNINYYLIILSLVPDNRENLVD